MEKDAFDMLQQYVLPHWPFVFMSFALGIMGQFFKKKVWTLDRALRKGGAWAFMHQTLGIHAPIIGAIAGALGAPVSPGVTGPIARALYHFVSGAMAAWTVAAFKHFMQARGIVLAESLAPPALKSIAPEVVRSHPVLGPLVPIPPAPPPPPSKKTSTEGQS